MTIQEKIKAVAIDHWLIVPLYFVGLFSSAFHAIPAVTVLYFPFLLYYSRKHWYNVIIAGIVNLLSFWTTILGLQDDLYGNGKFQHPWWMLVLAICCAVNVLFALVADFLASRHNYIALRVLVFPLVFTGSWLCIFGHWIGFGDGLAYSNSVILGFADIVQAATWLGGRPAVDFVLVLFATVVQEFSCSSERPVFENNEEEQEEQDERIQRPYALLLHPATWYAALVTLLAVFGGVLVHIHRNSFFQVAYPDYVPKNIPVGCVIGPGGINWQLQTDHDHWLNRSASLADAGAKLIAWSEETAFTQSYEEEDSLIQKSQAFAKEKSVYLMITYIQIIPPNISENKLVLIMPDGEVGINYKKAYPVPFIEPRPPGVDEIQFVDTPEFGRISAGICFDFNFPWFIRQASKHKVDVMVQSSWTWGPEGTYHGRSNGMRAVENGFTMLRCGSQGLSGVFEPTLNGIYSQQVPAITDTQYLFHLPIQKRVSTLYGVTGDVFGIGCFAVGFITTLYLIYYTAVKYRRGGQIQV